MSELSTHKSRHIRSYMSSSCWLVSLFMSFSWKNRRLKTARTTTKKNRSSNQYWDMRWQGNSRSMMKWRWTRQWDSSQCLLETNLSLVVSRESTPWRDPPWAVITQEAQHENKKSRSRANYSQNKKNPFSCFYRKDCLSCCDGRVCLIHSRLYDENERGNYIDLISGYLVVMKMNRITRGRLL